MMVVSFHDGGLNESLWTRYGISQEPLHSFIWPRGQKWREKEQTIQKGF